ncbi:MAG: cytochrome c maturation protein CcmE [Archaeoglobaceae archaeon]|nr:cytochrome c maturation protein CcmE [Archaeoglobaceae archaeon]MDW8014200.1 cytochrome c maturation protein CcmE [Archaeoglobaceae archaeon]
MSKKLIILFAIFMIFALLALIKSVSPYMTPSQVKSLEKAYEIKVIGKVEDVKIDGEKVVFYLADEKNKIKVVYRGSLNAEEVVVVGDWDGNVFHAKQVLTKCHTRYGD